MMPEWFWKLLNVVAIVVLAVSFYFNNNAVTGDNIARISERVSIVETRSIETERKTNQELLGYQELLKGVGIQLGEMNERLSRMEGRMEMTRRKP